MKSVLLRRSAFATLLSGLLLFSSCGSGGGIDAFFLAVTMSIGPGGGTIQSPDGAFKLIVPPGALGEEKNISVEQVDISALSAASQGVTPKVAYDIQPADIVFSTPVTVQIKGAGTSAITTAGGTIQNFFVPILDFIIVNDGLPSTQQVFYDGVLSGQSTVSVQVSQLGTFVLANLNGPGGFFMEVDAPQSLESGISDSIAAAIDVPGAAIAASPMPFVNWGLQAAQGSGLSFGIPSTTTTNFDSFTQLIPGMDTTLFDGTFVSCSQVQTSVFAANFDLRSFDINGLLASRYGSFFSGNIDVYSVSVAGSIDCTPQVAPVQAVYSFPSATFLESCRLVPSAYPTFTNPAQPHVTIADDAGMLLVNAYDGTVEQDLQFTTGFGFTDAVALPIPPGQSGNASLLAVSGGGCFQVDVDQFGGVIGQPFQPSLDSVFQLNFVDNDPSKGGSAIDVEVNSILPLSFQQGLWILNSQGTSLQVTAQSLATSSQSSNFLLVEPGFNFSTQVPGNLYLGVPSGTGGASLNFVTALGSDPFQLVWDPSSGVGAITDPTDNTVTLIFWDGSGLPFITDVVSVGAAPVRCDVFGSKVLVGNFADDTISLITVDANGLATGVSTTPLPAGSTSPSGVAFLHDSFNSIFVACQGSSTGVFIPGFF